MQLKVLVFTLVMLLPISFSDAQQRQRPVTKEQVEIQVLEQELSNLRKQFAETYAQLEAVRQQYAELVQQKKQQQEEKKAE